MSDGDQDEDLPLFFSTQSNGHNLTGVFNLPSRRVFHRLTLGGKNVHLFEVALSSDPSDSMSVMLPASKAVSLDLMVLCAFCKVTLVDYVHPLVEIFIRPRARLENKLNVDILLQTPMPHTYSRQQKELDNENTLHTLSPFDSMEIFTRGPSVAAKIKFSSAPDNGDLTDWTSWIEIPLRMNQQRMHPIKGCFPFLGQDRAENSLCIGNMFVLSEDNYIDMNITDNDDTDPGIRTLSLAAENLGVDHTGEILFQAYFLPEQQNRASFARRTSSNAGQYTFSSFSSSYHKGKISFLPESAVPLRVISISKKNHMRKTLPFMIDDIAFCNGGLESSPLFWDDEKPSGYFAYRKLSLLSQMELHIIPSFVIFNGGDDPVVVKMSHSEEFKLLPGDIAPLLHSDHRLGLIVQLFYPSLRLLTSPIRVEALGSKVSLTKKVPSGAALGSVTLQTVIGVQDSCFVVNIGSIKYGRKSMTTLSWLRDDFMRLRVRWSKIDITFNDTAHPVPLHDSTSRQPVDQVNIKTKAQLFVPVHYSVARIVMERFTVDFQRIFKAEEVFMDEKLSPERCQFSMIVKNLVITDCLSNTVVLQASNFLHSSSNNGNFFDLCIRTRGSEDSGITLVDLFDLKLSQANGLAVPLIVNTNESFLWSLIDIASRTKLAIGELSGIDIELSWDEINGEYSVVVMHLPLEERASEKLKNGVYRSPGNDRLLSIRVASVSPVAFKLSFRRQPQKSRYTASNQVAVGANFVNYFTTRLKFTVDNAEIRFPGFIEKQVKGPPDRIVEEIKAFYLSQLKFKLLNLVTATSLDDWKELTGREDGTERYVEGDILRLTGNLAGRSANFLFKQVGSGLGSSVKVGSEAIGSGIQVMTEAMGVGAVGAGVNSVVSGLGEGVGKSVTSSKFYVEVAEYTDAG
jgi:vacuolar protein sorting-associated protein 13A/C